MARPTGQFAKIVKSKSDARWYVRYPHPDKVGKTKTETFRKETEAVDRKDSLNALHETERRSLKTEQWTVNKVLSFWVEKKASGLVSSVKEVPRAEYIGGCPKPCKKRKDEPELNDQPKHVCHSGVIGGVKIADLDEDHYEMLLRHIKADKTRRVKTDRGFDAYFVTLRTALNYAKRKNKIRAFPALDDYINGDYDPRERVVSVDEFEELVNACHVKKGGRDRSHLASILVWLHETACRSGELKTIKVGDIDLEKGIVRIRQSKRKAGAKTKHRECGISPRLQEMIIESGLLEFDDNDLVIGKPLGMPNTAYDFKRAFGTACRLAKAERVKNELNGDCFDDLNIHDLRHTGITNMLERGVALPLVASMVGHEAESVMTLKVYTKFRQNFIAQEMLKMAA